MKQIIDTDDIMNIKPISANNKNKAGQLIKEVSDLWGAKLLGNQFYQYVCSTDDDIKELLEGGEYTSCNGNTMYQPGLKTVFVYLFWSRYVYDINYIDTPTGMVSKQREDSNQLSLGHLANLSSNFETMAMNYFSLVEEYILANRSQYPLYKGCKKHTTNLRPSIVGVKNKNIK